MPRFTPLFRLVALAALVALASGKSVAQDEAKASAAAKKANDALGKIQQALAEDTSNLKQLRIDQFVAEEGKIVVFGVYVNAAQKADTNAKLFGDKAEDVIIKQAGLEKGIVFNWEGAVEKGKKQALQVFGTVGGDGKWQEGLVPPHVKIQDAANAVGGGADRVYLTGARFTKTGELALTGYRAKDDKTTEDWLTADGLKALAGHAAAYPGKDGKLGDKAKVTFAEIAPVDWVIGASAVQKMLAESTNAAFKRTRADRVFLKFDGPRPYLQITGVRIGADKLGDEEISDAVVALWPALKGVVGQVADTIKVAAADPASAVQEKVVTVRDLDGIRVDPGAVFDRNGAVQLVGLRPDTGDLTENMTKAFQAAAAAKAAAGDAEQGPRYNLLKTSKVSVAGMRPIAWEALYSDMRRWARAYRDDVRFRRLLFTQNLKPFENQYYSVAKNGGGLVLVYQTTATADDTAVATTFQGAFAARFKDGLGTAPEPLAAASKEPHLPGLTAALRAELAATSSLPAEKNPWYGVLIRRGYFDTKDQYTIDGAVNDCDQNAKLWKLLEDKAKDPKWQAYFRDAEGKDQAIAAPDLKPIPMKTLEERVKVVALAYPTFDGIRIERADYDKDSVLVFRAHAIGRVSQETKDKLAQLLLSDSLYQNRVGLGDRPNAPAKVNIVVVSGPDDADDQVARFGLAFGSKLLAEAIESKNAQAKAKAKAWLDVALLHYPHESAVWFLNARYNQFYAEGTQEQKDELLKRDLYRVVALEGPLAFNGPAQRKRRYEAAKDFQGTARADLEEQWLKAFREYHDGAKPIVLNGKAPTPASCPPLGPPKLPK